MDDDKLDLKAIANRLRAEFTVEPGLPFQMQLMLAHLARAEAHG